VRTIVHCWTCMEEVQGELSEHVDHHLTVTGAEFKPLNRRDRRRWDSWAIRIAVAGAFIVWVYLGFLIWK